MAVVLIFSSVEKDSNERIQLLNQNINSKINQFFEVPSTMLLQLKKTLEASDDIRDHYEVDSQLTTALKYFTSFSRILLLDRNGEVLHLVPFNNDFLGNDFSQQSFFINTDTEEKISWSPVFISAITGKPTVTASVRSNQNVIVAYLNIEKMLDLIFDIEVAYHGYTVLADRYGTIVAHPDKSLMQQSHSLSSLDPVKRAIAGETGQMIVQEIKWNISVLIPR